MSKDKNKKNKGKLKRILSFDGTTSQKQMRRLYLDQKRRKREQEKKRKRVEKWGSCCIL